MRDWKKIASTLNPAIPDDAVDRFASTLDALTTALDRLRSQIPAGADVWTTPEDLE
jgi:hypothetical protein